jgi:hypothetical protein
MSLKESITYHVKYHCPPIYSMEALTAAYLMGINDGMQKTIIDNSSDMHIEVNLEEVRYESLDKSVTITDIAELMQSLGKGPEEAATNIVRTLKYSEKRELNINEVEKLRRAQALLRLVPNAENIFCDKGQDKITQLNETITKYEDKFRQP